MEHLCMESATGTGYMELITVKTRVTVPSGGDRREPQRLSS